MPHVFLSRIALTRPAILALHHSLRHGNRALSSLTPSIPPPASPTHSSHPRNRQMHTQPPSIPIPSLHLSSNIPKLHNMHNTYQSRHFTPNYRHIIPNPSPPLHPHSRRRIDPL
ncbi:hypothetical protein K505DRAFT_329024 [Melanomma pulvis-pyrius CBS 109.77]|uniref:Uncharacterized protein n=1 Tax=Melanomma pulvis-pyrius CBS 109.77 TaxID=1314802 RepID=A0A6A6WWN6_9PLEO|nr:hypothetical protein K505DRAFT_329024 [Melanomma pulvis-pyrius CBS 109.77]